MYHKRVKSKNSRFDPFVIPLVQNSNSLLEDLRRLNILKDATHPPDLDVDKSNNPKIIKAQTPKSEKLKR